MSKPVDTTRKMEKEAVKEVVNRDGLTNVSETQTHAKNKLLGHIGNPAPPTGGGNGTVPPPATISKPIISSNSTPIMSETPTPTSEAVFKIPKKIPLSLGSTSGNPILNAGNAGNSKLNKKAIGNLNQSLMAKQKIISKNEPFPKSHASITESINISPRTTSFPLSVNGTPAEEIRNPISSDSPTSVSLAQPTVATVDGSHHGAALGPAGSVSINSSAPSTIQSPSEEISEVSTPRPPKSEKTKKLNNQVSTRTDFFAAKLASAVDDVDSSDSDETFVYENNAPGYDTQSLSNQSMHESSNNTNTTNPTNTAKNNTSGNGGITTSNTNVNTNYNNNNNGEFHMNAASVGQAKTENQSKNGSLLNAPGTLAPAGISLSSPPVLDQSYDDNHNSTLNSISTNQTELQPTETMSANSTSRNHKPNASVSNTNDAPEDLVHKHTTTAEDVQHKEVVDTENNQVSTGNFPAGEKTNDNNNSTANFNLQQNSTANSNSKDFDHLHLQHSLAHMEINSSNTSTPLVVGKTDSIQSLRSIKFPKANNNANSKAPVNSNESNVSGITLNKEVTTISGKERPQTQRSNSLYSMSHPSIKGITTAAASANNNITKSNVDEDVLGIQASPNGSTILGTVNSNSFNDGHGGSGSGTGLFDGRSSYQHSRTANSINETYTNEDRFSSDDNDEDAEVIEDIASNNGEFYVNESADTTLNRNSEACIGPETVNPSLETMHQRPQVAGSISKGGLEGNKFNLFDNFAPPGATSSSNFGTNSVVSKQGGEAVGGRRNKSSTTSSKLRSTTSKLFDKKGSQPRRYSIIPDDIDIEDFDDELIYYDNNIRFPYSNNSINGNSAIGNFNQFNENSPLLDGGVGGTPGRIPHYRSLNLNPANNGGKKGANYKSKRYLSGGPQLLNSPTSGTNTPPNDMVSPNTINRDMFPFPYSEANQPYYYDFDEYDEDAPHSDSVDKNNFTKFGRKSSRNFSGYSGNGGHQLTASNGHFFLPRKRSSTNFENQRANCIRSFLYTLISIFAILSIGFIMGFILATTKELTHVSVLSVDNTLVSQDELVFNIVVEAFNPGWFSVEIQEVELDIFAKSGYLPDPDDGDNPGDGGGDGDGGEEYNFSSISKISGIESELRVKAVETVLLGSIFTLETPMYFRGGFVNRSPVKQVAEVKLVKPGSNLSTLIRGDGNATEPEVPDNSKKWEVISKNPFDIIIRGLLKYKLPLTKNFRSVVVKKTSYVDPNDS